MTDHNEQNRRITAARDLAWWQAGLGHAQRSLPTSPAPLRIHALHEGLPLCRFAVNAPAYWPESESWTTPQDLQTMRLPSPNVKCPTCLREARQRFQV